MNEKDFYSLNNYENNTKEFLKFISNDLLNPKINLQNQKLTSIEKMLNSLSLKIESHDKALSNLEDDIFNLKKDYNSIKEVLFYPQLRDAIKAFVDNLCLSLQIKNLDNFASDVETVLKSIIPYKNEGVEMVMNIS